MSVLAEIAVQLKTSLSFLLGLAGMFTIFRTGLTAAIGMPKVPADPPALATDVAAIRKRLWWVLGAIFLLLALAVYLYVGPINGIDVAAVARGQALTRGQGCAIVTLIVISLAILALDILATVWRRVLGEKAAAAK